MTDEQRRQRQREKSGAHYAANKEAILERQRQKRRDPVAGAELRARNRERIASLTPAERDRRAQLNRDWYRRNPAPTPKTYASTSATGTGLHPNSASRFSPSKTAAATYAASH
jgi:hypothetical protein